jgi:hypothetical protein
VDTSPRGLILSISPLEFAMGRYVILPALEEHSGRFSEARRTHWAGPYGHCTVPVLIVAFARSRVENVPELHETFCTHPFIHYVLLSLSSQIQLVMALSSHLIPCRPIILPVHKPFHVMLIICPIISETPELCNPRYKTHMPRRTKMPNAVK